MPKPPSTSAVNTCRSPTGPRVKRNAGAADAELMRLLEDCRAASENSVFRFCTEIAPGLWDDHGQFSWEGRVFRGDNDSDFADSVAMYFLGWFWQRPLRAKRGGAAA